MMIWRSLSPRALASVLTWLVSHPPRLRNRRIFGATIVNAQLPPPTPLPAPLRSKRHTSLVRHNR